MFKTVDGGDHWTQINVGLSGFGVTAVALGPGPSPVLYTATQEGFFGSTNGGTSWDLVGVLPLIFPPTTSSSSRTILPYSTQPRVSTAAASSAAETAASTGTP